MSLESRAARAARSLQASVATVTPVDVRGVVHRQRLSMVTTFAAAAVLALAFAGIASAMPSFVEGDRIATDSPIPDPDIPVVVAPDDDPDDAVVELDREREVLPLRQTNAMSDSPEPYTKFSGTAPPGTTVSASSAWGSAELVVDGRGEFVLRLDFDPLPPTGVEFPIVVTVGATAYEFGFTSTWDPDAVDVTASQMYGSSDDPEPYEKLFGTAPPGTEVVASSPYGDGAAVADDTGHWSLKLWFDTLPPAGTPFDIVVAAADQEFVFGFVSSYAKPVATLSVTQKNTTSDSSSPYVRFVGSGAAGTSVQVQSPYGSTSTTIGASESFDLKLFFSSLPPAGQQFSVTVRVDGTTYGTYPFTSYYAQQATGGGGGEVEVSQYNTESWDADPWAKFLVEGPTGTSVQILSPYGSVSKTTSSLSEYVKLWFSSLPPAGVEFSLTVEVDGETHGTYPFTSHYDPAGVAVSVSQYNTESWDADPWVKFNLTGPAGTQVDILSPYGSVSHTMASTSEHKKLFFSSLPPAGEEFQVTVKMDGDVWGTYPFTSHYEEPPPPVAKTANATYGTCSEDPPYDIYFGTAPEGTSVSITSPYGSGSTTANGSGEWSTQVFFSGAPLDETFTVNVQVGGASFSFPMVVTAP